jgi:cation:H+ antiporter
LAQDFGVSEWVIGVTIVAMGTSAPELATSMTAALRGKHGLTAGNLIGSDLFNMLAVLGVASALRPLSVNAAARVDLWVLLAMVLVVVAVMRHGWRISRADGALLLLLASGRWALTLLP